MLSLPLRARCSLLLLVARAVLGRLLGPWLAMLLLGAVFFGPNGLCARDLTRGARAVPWAGALLFALWCALHQRAARVLEARAFAFLRASPLGRGERALLRAPGLAPHLLAGAFVAKGEGPLAGVLAGVLAALGTSLLAAALRGWESSGRAHSTRPAGLLSAHLRFALRADPAALARSTSFALGAALLAALATYNTRANPLEGSSLASVLLLVASGSVASTAVTVVAESEAALSLLLRTQPGSMGAAARARRLLTWGGPALLGGALAAGATGSLGALAALRVGRAYALLWLGVALVVARGRQRGMDVPGVAALATVALVLTTLALSVLEALALAVGAGALALLPRRAATEGAS